MSETCPNAHKSNFTNVKTKQVVYRCTTDCLICRGKVYVTDCPDCDGCGLRRGGIKCDTCHCYGKVPEPAAQASEAFAV